MKYIIFALFLNIVITSNIYAGEAVNTKVTNAGINSKGEVFVTFADALVQDGCDARKQLVLPPDSTIKDHVLSVALSANASGSEVQIKPAGCYGTSPSLLPNYSPHGWIFSR